MNLKRIAVLLAAIGAAAACRADDQITAPVSAIAGTQSLLKSFVETNCISCHDQATRTGGLALDELLEADIGRHADVWEKVVRKLSAREMPPKVSARPDERSYDEFVSSLESSLDDVASLQLKPGRTESFRRLNRAEYQNAIRDLLALEVDASVLLPPDESSHGFDNITVADLPPTLLSRYISAAQKISRLAVGTALQSPQADTIRLRPDITQDTHIEGLPLGTRGGTLISHNFVQTGDYEVQVRLMRDRNEGVEGLSEPHELEIALDRQRIAVLDISPPPKGHGAQSIDANLNVRTPVTAGPHKLGVAFLKKSSSLLETERQPLNVHFNFYRHPRIGPAVYEVSILGPFKAAGSGDTPSRQQIFVCNPTKSDDEEKCAKQIFSNLAHRVYRRPIDDRDVQTPLRLYRQAIVGGNFDAGIEAGLSSILVNPQFLFRIERDPPGVPPHTAYRIGDLELATRLSFFLWSSIPDESLLERAAQGELSRPDVLEHEVRRMLADERSRALVSNFAGQWLYLRNLDSANPDMRLFPDFDDNLRQALRQETELFFQSVLQEDRSALELIHSDYTYLNERLAKHYGIPHVFGSQFRRVTVDSASHRGGLLRQGSILTVTSYADRTSPVLRGNWVLKNLIGMPSPPPPANVPALDNGVIAATLPVRERLKQHRADVACASCHQRMDPVGFALENFDAVGRWRELETGKTVDSSGGLPDGSEFAGVAGLEQALLRRPELFVRTLAEKLMTYAIGRGVDYDDAPAIRKIVRESRDDNYRLSRLIVGIVNSAPFQMRSSP